MPSHRARPRCLKSRRQRVADVMHPTEGRQVGLYLGVHGVHGDTCCGRPRAVRRRDPGEHELEAQRGATDNTRLVLQTAVRKGCLNEGRVAMLETKLGHATTALEAGHLLVSSGDLTEDQCADVCIECVPGGPGQPARGGHSRRGEADTLQAAEADALAGGPPLPQVPGYDVVRELDHGGQERGAVKFVALSEASDTGFQLSLECDEAKVKTYGRTRIGWAQSLFSARRA